MTRTVLAALFLLGACASAGGGGPTPNSLAGSEWVMLNESRSETPPTMTFTADRASGHAGCNRWFASANASGHALAFDAIGTTRMMCAPPLMEIERAFTATLENTRGYHIENDELVLHDLNGEALARFRRAD